jgi:hypothetical protein
VTVGYRTPVEYAVTKITERQEELKSFIASGTIKEFTEYYKICGLIQGLESAKEIILDLAKRTEQLDE